MINEIRPKESSEIKTPEANKYKEIKPESGTTYSDSKQFWQDEFSENQADRTYYDDNGEKYRQGNELEPNTVFEKNGYTYKTDEIGRVVSAEGKLQVKDHKGRNEMPDTRDIVAHGKMADSDDRGHLIADRFNGKDIKSGVVLAALAVGDYFVLDVFVLCHGVTSCIC